MFVFFIERTGGIHIVDYKSSRGFYRSICDKIVHQNELVNTLAADASIDSICRTCHDTYNDMYISDLDIKPRMARNNTHLKLTRLLQYAKLGVLGVKSKYAYILEYRVTDKLNNYKKLLTKKPNKYAK